jgi:hypothetical protein
MWFCTPFISQWTEDSIFRLHFQQDSATAHTARVSMALLHDVFGDRLTSRDIWPPRSPDLTPPDVYLWEALKSAVYRDKPRSFRDMKETLTHFIMVISHSELV